MVLSSSTRTSRISSLVNQTNVCGGVKKAGFGRSTDSTANSRAVQTRTITSIPMFCFVNSGVRTQRTGVQATRGGV